MAIPASEAASATPAATPSRFVDWTAPFSIALVLLLAALVLLPMFRLLITSLTSDSGQLSLEHYRQLFVDPAFAVDIRGRWHSVHPCRRADGLARLANRPAG